MGNTSLTILLAEDDPDDRQLILEAFSKIDSTLYLHMVADGKSALAYLNSLQDSALPCLIVLDYNMPQLNGPEVLKHLCTNERYITSPKVVLSTSDAPTYIQECLKYGANKYIVKPTNFDELVNIAKGLLDWCTATP